jgi:hypothetical protein
VHRSAVFRQRKARDADDLAIREVLGDDGLGALVLCGSEYRHEHDAVGHEIVAVRGVGEMPRNFRAHRVDARRRKADDVEPASALVSVLCELALVSGEPALAGVALVVRRGGEDRRLVDEAGSGAGAR